MAQVKKGDTVKIHYTGKLEDGKEFDSSKGKEPLKFKIGGAQIIPGFEEAVIGMKKGESKTINISPEKAYGPHKKELVLTVDKSKIPENIKPKKGEQLQLKQSNGQTVVVTIAEISGSTITLDANHPLAGKNLIFDIELVEIA